MACADVPVLRNRVWVRRTELVVVKMDNACGTRPGCLASATGAWNLGRLVGLLALERTPKRIAGRLVGSCQGINSPAEAHDKP